MNMFPNKLNETKLVGVLERIESGNRPKGGIKKIKEGIPSLGGEHLNNSGGFNFENLRLIPEEYYESLRRGIVQRYDVLVVKDGATTGKTSFVDDNFPYEKAAINEHLFLLRGKEELINQKFLYYHLISPLGQRQIKRNFHGAAIGGINTQFTKNYELALPPLSVQKKIVSILEKAEKLKKWREEVDDLVDEFLKSTFLEMFGDPVNNTKGWEKRALKDFGNVMTGNTPPRKISEFYGDYIEWIKSDNINTPYTYLTKSNEMLSRKGADVGRVAPRRSVLVTCIAGSLSCIGNAAVANREVAFNQQINAIIPNNSTDELFLYHLILNTKEYIQANSTQSMKGMISKSVFESIQFIFPPTELQSKFGEIARQVEKICESQRESTIKIDFLFDALMQKAFKGEISC